MNKPTSDVISSYRKRRKAQGPFIIYGLAALLILGGIISLIVWLMGPSQPLSAIFATDTPTPTVTPSATVTFTSTATSTETLTPTITFTPTPSAPFDYIVQEGEYLAIIIEKFNLGDDGLSLIVLLNGYSVEGADFSVDPGTLNVYPGQKLHLPYPGMPLPTATPIPADLPRGTKIDYYVQAGDTIALIAAKFNSTPEEIVKLNELQDVNTIFIGQKLVIPVNLVTATATRPPTSTPVTPGTLFPTFTSVFTVTPSITPTP
ncbi:MAG: LysM peptidoglycan-binding domain-containing protein [Chloroflexi bacterium]|nr:LysM peptidoglycan-binding domain-containing protein [Chloroflexota bacterium]